MDLIHPSQTVDALRRSFVEPSAESRPTPLYWWSGGDLDRERLAWQLDQLAGKGIGGTIVGYSHLPDGGLDHGDPEPLSPDWWELMRWFVAASADRGMTVGAQDYGIIGGILLKAADRTRGFTAGSLENSFEIVTGPAVITRDIDADASRRAVERGGSRVLDAARVESGQVSWTLPEGEWILSTVRSVTGKIGLFETDFDPMHPDSGAAVIDLFYERFAEELGEGFGTTFTTFFQDELDLGLMMPMWNSLVSEALAARGFDPDAAQHLLWHGDSDEVMTLRAAYRDIVVDLLESNYFRPIFEWHEAHSTMIVMDQMSRGDLRLGHKHYADFLQTMAWYHGPGNDDPDLTDTRKVAAFKTSASIAHLHGRPRVTNEAFHSSGWGVTPHMIVGGLNVGFAAGANQVMLHGLDYTTDGGWWEWASPDFHFRQPWWEHSAALWSYISRVSEMLRSGVDVSDVAIVDPTPDLDFDSTSPSPETARELIVELGEHGINGDFVPQAYLADAIVSHAPDAVQLRVLQARYRAVVLPGVRVIRTSALDALNAFVAAGGVVLVVGRMPERTEFAALGSTDTEGWHLVDVRPGALATELRRLIDVDLDAESDTLMQVHRSVGEADLHFLVNSGEQAIDVDCGFRAGGRMERWDPWTGQMSPVDDATIVPDHRGVSRLRTRVGLEPQESVLLYIEQTQTGATAPTRTSGTPTSTLSLATGWTASIAGTMDNRFGDYVSGAEELEVASYHVEASAEPTGPWAPALVDHGVRFWALGPVSGNDVEAMDQLLPTLERVDPSSSALAWRPYRLSLSEGMEQDPYLLDRLTGPHGLKGVPSEYLDPRYLDESPEPGAAYYFWSTVVAPAGPTTVVSQGRCAYSVWVDRVDVRSPEETEAAFFPPWGLRDMSTTPLTSQVELADGVTPVLVKVVVSADQPSRVAVALGGSLPSTPERSRLLWWQADDPALEFTVDEPEDEAALVWIRAEVPLGAVEATVPTSAELVDTVGGSASAIPGGYRIILEATDGSPLTFSLREPAARAAVPDAGALTGPITWVTGAREIELAPWENLGLRDFSGVVVYERSVTVDDLQGARADLVLSGLQGSAHVTINGVPAGTLYSPTAQLRVDGLLHDGSNELRIECANTLVNLYSRLPSPFAIMQSPGGGFTNAELVIT